MIRRLFLLTAFLASSAAFACGPFFPNSYLLWGDLYDEDPWGSFRNRLDYAFPSAQGEIGDLLGASEKWQNTWHADRGDLWGALTKAGMIPGDAAEVLKRYDELRLAMAAHGDGQGGQVEVAAGVVLPSFDLRPFEDMVNELPKEFRLYLRGAAAYRSAFTADAVDHWHDLLELPERERHFRTVWAYFMLGKAAARQGNYEAALLQFEACRKASASGFVDTLRLGQASLGWAARMHLQMGHLRDALHLYLRLLRTGTPEERHVAYASLYAMCSQRPRAWDSRSPFISDPEGRQVMAVFLSNAGERSDEATHFLSALQAAGLTEPVKSAGMLARAAYERGAFAEAEKWLELAFEDDVPGIRTRARLALREGDFETASTLMTQAAAIAKETPERLQAELEPLQADLGRLRMEQGDFLGAFDAFLIINKLDAGYLADCVLTVDELAGYLEAHLAEFKESEALPGEKWTRKARLTWAGNLLGRRLVRAGDYERAKRYFDPEKAALVGNLADKLAIGGDERQSIWARALNLMDAARIYREHGMELSGTEYFPDYAVTDGRYAFPDAISRRLKMQVSEQEQIRWEQARNGPQKRLHYRYVAADLMWEAAGLLPNNHLLTAQALYEGGCFIKARDPQAADRFYKALVNRCRKLPIGQRADEKRWFPTSFEDEDDDR